MWTYRDEFGRPESNWTPAPVAAQDYVLTEQTYLPGSGSTYASIAARDVLGRATQVNLTGGAVVEQEFDLLGRVDWRRATASAGDWRLQDYSYDNRGRVDGVVASSSTGLGSTGTFTYDEPGWLAQEVYTDASGTRTIDYGYDVAGNRLSRVETTGSGSTSRAYTYGYGNVLATVDGSSVSWNAFGETITDHRGVDIDRAGDGAEVGVTDSAGVPLYGFTRGPGGEAVEVEEAATGDLRSFLWGPAEADFPVSTLDESGADQAYVAIEGMVAGRLDGGSFVPMVQTAQGGMLLDGSDFLDAGLAFGEDSAVVAGSPERRVWALLESLPGTTYKLPRRRLYDEETGRFASQDPIGLAGGDHRFAYLNGDPMGGVDPSGLMGVNRIAPFTRDGAPLGWDLTTTGKSIPAWMRAAGGNAPPSWMGIDPGCGNDPFCIRADGDPPPETEEAESEVDAGASGGATEVEFEAVLVGGGMHGDADDPGVDEESSGDAAGEPLWQDAVADEMEEGDTGIVTAEGSFETYNDNGGLDGGTPSPIDMGTGFQGLKQTMVDGVSLQYSAIPRIDTLGDRKTLVAHGTLRIIARPSRVDRSWVKWNGIKPALNLPNWDSGHTWVQLDFALENGKTKRRVYSFAFETKTWNLLAEAPGEFSTAYLVQGGECFVGFALSQGQTQDVNAAAEAFMRAPPKFVPMESNCTDFAVKMAAEGGFDVSNLFIDSPDSICAGTDNKFYEGGKYRPNEQTSWILP